MIHLNRNQQLALGTVILMLLTGWAVKAYRNTHPPDQRVNPALNPDDR